MATPSPNRRGITLTPALTPAQPIPQPQPKHELSPSPSPSLNLDLGRSSNPEPSPANPNPNANANEQAVSAQAGRSPVRRGAPPGARWLQPSDRSLESALVQRIGGGGGGGTSPSASVQEAEEALRRAEAAELLGAAAQAAAVDLRAPRPTVSTVGRGIPHTPHHTSSRTSRTPAPRPTPHSTPHPPRNQRSSARTRPIPHPFFARCPCPYTVEPYTVEALCTPLEQLWAGEIPRLEAEKRAAKQVGRMAREDKDSYGEARHVAQPICICMARPKGGGAEGQLAGLRYHALEPRGVAMHFACRRARRPTQRCARNSAAGFARSTARWTTASSKPSPGCTRCAPSSMARAGRLTGTVSATGRSDWGSSR